jgi:hypothetical protein
MTPLILTFVALQSLDVATTLVGLRLGASEANPLVRAFLSFGPVTGLLLVKLGGLGLVLAAFASGRGPRMLRKLNWLFGALGAWNLFILARAVL